jgi:hypothetical protein
MFRHDMQPRQKYAPNNLSLNCLEFRISCFEIFNLGVSLQLRLQRGYDRRLQDVQPGSDVRAKMNA